MQTNEGEASKRGAQYEVASGERIPYLGEKRFKGYTEEGLVRNLTAQVCEVSKSLLIVRKAVEAGNPVVFGSATCPRRSPFPMRRCPPPCR